MLNTKKQSTREMNSSSPYLGLPLFAQISRDLQALFLEFEHWNKMYTEGAGPILQQYFEVDDLKMNGGGGVLELDSYYVRCLTSLDNICC